MCFFFFLGDMKADMLAINTIKPRYFRLSAQVNAKSTGPDKYLNVCTRITSDKKMKK